MQDAFDHFADHGETAREGAPARFLDRLSEFRLRQQALAERAGSRVGVIVDVSLHEISRLLVDEDSEVFDLADRRRASEEPEKSHAVFIREPKEKRCYLAPAK